MNHLHLKNSKVAEAPMKSVQVKVTELSNGTINDHTNNVHSEPEVFLKKVLQSFR